MLVRSTKSCASHKHGTQVFHGAQVFDGDCLLPQQRNKEFFYERHFPYKNFMPMRSQKAHTASAAIVFVFL